MGSQSRRNAMREIGKIKESIAKKEASIAKIEKKIERLSAKVEASGKEIAKAQDREARVSYIKWLDYGAQWDFDDLWRAYGDLADAKAVLAKYNVELEKAVNFENEEKIPAIWEFLLDWASKVREYYLINAKSYYDLRASEAKEFEEWKATGEFKKQVEERIALKCNAWSAEYAVEEEWKQNRYFYIDGLTKELTSIKWKRVPNPVREWESDYVAESYSVDEAKLDSIIARERDDKYRDLVHRITKVAGEILDASDLRIGEKGNICGIVKGSRKNAYVETIPCAGYNIVRFHYRVIVNAPKSLNPGK